MEMDISFVVPFKKPLNNAKLVVFRNVHPYIPDEMTGEFLDSCQKYAKVYGVYLVTCLFALRDYLCVAIVNREGAFESISKASHLNLVTGKKFKRSGDIEVTQTPLGKIFACVDTDIYYPEIARVAVLQGCDLIVSSQYIDEVDFDKQMLSAGAFNISQQNCVHVAAASNISASVYAPGELTGDRSGIVLPVTTDFPAAAHIDTGLTYHSREKLKVKLTQNNLLLKHYSLGNLE